MPGKPEDAEEQFPGRLGPARWPHERDLRHSAPGSAQGLVKGYTHLVCGPCSNAGKGPDVPSRPGTVLVHTFDVAGFFGGYTYRIATAEERAGIDRAAALARAAFLNVPEEPES